MSIDWEALLLAARNVREHAYAPYSGYRVGAAILAADGHVYTGVNVENVSFGLTVCAERTALGSMITSGCLEIVAVAISTADGGSPCGMCRQSLAEFAPDLAKVPILCAGDDGQRRQMTLADLLPAAFKAELKNQAPLG
jgi:cytidine deaminase